MMEKMKNSGICWIGDIPESWNLLRMKDCSYMKGRIGWQGLTADEFIDEGPYLITGTDFDNGRVCWDRSYHISEKRYEEDRAIQVKEGDLLVTKDGTIGKLAYIDYMPGIASLNSHLLLIRPLREQYINRFLYWVLSSPVFQGYYELVASGSTMDSISQEKIGNFHFFVPNVAKQKVIADYLDKQCAKLDGIITDLGDQIEILQKYKKSLITETVTKGLDKSAVLKDSGIQWIGLMPRHWSVKKLKYLFRIFSGSTPDTSNNEYWDGEVRWITPADYKTKDKYVFGGERSITKNGYNSCGAILTPENSIIFSKRAPIGTVAINKVELCTNQGCFSCVPIKNTNSAFYYYFMSVTTDVFDLFGSGSTFKEISQSAFGNVKVPCPPYKEQEEIVLFLDRKTEKIDQILSVKAKQLEIIKSNRESLIFEYVTGKKYIKEAM